MARTIDLRGAVYVLENTAAQRVKVGMTINSTTTPESRARDANNVWLGRVGACQVCGTRIMLSGGTLPNHRVSGAQCKGGGRPALHLDISVAQSYLAELETELHSSAGMRKNSLSRMVSTLKKRIEKFRNYESPPGIWKLITVYYTSDPHCIEQETHIALQEYKDVTAPIGEVFRCTVAQAQEAVEAVFSCHNLPDQYRKEVIGEAVAMNGECPICGNQLTDKGVCIECRDRVFG